MRKFISLLLLLSLIHFHLTQASTAAEDITAWQALWDTAGGSSWSVCAGKRSDPCTCSFVTCSTSGGSNKVTVLAFPSSLYTSTNKNLGISLLNAFTSMTSITLGSGIAWTFDACFQFAQSATSTATCSRSSGYGFCCFEKHLTTFFDTFNGASWTQCSGRRETLCACNPTTNTNIQVQCTNGVASSITLKGNSLTYSGSSFDPSVINNLISLGVKFIDLGSNAGIVLSAQNCVTLSGCSNQGVSCSFPNSFNTCAPTAAPITASPSVSPITSEPTLAPTTSEPTIAPTTSEPTFAPTTSEPTLAPTTSEPTVSPSTSEPTLLPTSFPSTSPITSRPSVSPTSSVPTASPLTCDMIDQEKVSKRLKLCAETLTCEIINRRCVFKTPEPTNSPTDVETCDGINSLNTGLNKRKQLCKHVEGCEFRSGICVTITLEPTPSPTELPTQSPTGPITCIAADRMKRKEREQICETIPSCILVHGRCISSTKNPTASPLIPIDFPSSSPTEPLTCAEVDLLGPKQRKSLCNQLPECTLNLGRCVDLTSSPTSGPIISTAFPTANPTESLSCAYIDTLGQQQRQQLCLTVVGCALISRRCVELTDSPTVSLVVPTQFPSTAPTVPRTCLDVDAMGPEQRKALCDTIEGCDLVHGRCIEITSNPSHSPTPPTSEPTNSPSMPIICTNLNTLPRQQRAKQCMAAPNCILVGTMCTAATLSPSLAPTTIDEYACSELMEQNLTKNEIKTECLSRMELAGCDFITGNADSDYLCIQSFDDSGKKICQTAEQQFTFSARKSDCKQYSYCHFDNLGANSKGVCFELAECSDINKFGKDSKKKTFCKETELNGGLNCIYDDVQNTCSESV